MGTPKGGGFVAVHHVGKLAAMAMATCHRISHKESIAQPICLALCQVSGAYVPTAAWKI
jgi:hypothetical protein